VKRIWIAIGSVALVAVLVVGLVQAGGGSSSNDPEGSGPSEAELKEDLAGAPDPLAKLHAQGGELLPGGVEAFRERLGELRGHPVVVNKWASWCGPCRAEFPDFQRASVEYGKRVAFLGVDGNDNREDAEEFLEEFPISYPSYEDPDGRIAQVMQASIAFPSTAFYDRTGKLTYVKQGQYLSRGDLERDIERYALR
jgi:cytochrome c biogenesis protein CcmG, thiol:disulfide interchange protein DsbE